MANRGLRSRNNVSSESQRGAAGTNTTVNNTTDVTEMFELFSSSVLTEGSPLLYDPRCFSLHESMAALEVMDPGMDRCETKPKARQPTNANAKYRIDTHSPTQTGLRMTSKRLEPPTSFDDSLLGPAVPWNKLTMDCAARISIEALARLWALLNGSSAGESVFTCIYAHLNIIEKMRMSLGMTSLEHLHKSSSSEESSLPQKAVMSLAVGLVKVNDLIHMIVKDGDIYEEEDFNMNTCGLNTSPYATLSLDAIPEFEPMASLFLRQMTPQEYRQSNDLVNQWASRSKTEVGNCSYTIVIVILDFLTDLLDTCAFWVKNKAPPKETGRESALKDQHSLLLDSESFSKLKCCRYEDSFVTAKHWYIERYQVVSPLCFDAGINFRLSGNTPVRQASSKFAGDALRDLARTLSELAWAEKAVIFDHSTTCPRRMLNVTRRTTSYGSNILQRSCLALNLALGGNSHLQSVAKNIVSYGVPVAAFDSEFGALFVSQVGKCTLDVSKLLSINRCRQRSLMERCTFADWARIQKDGRAVDYYITIHYEASQRNMPGHVSSSSLVTKWASLVTAWLMEHYILLSLELRLVHQRTELSYTYWYMNFILSVQLNIMATMQTAASIKRENCPTSKYSACTGQPLKDASARDIQHLTVEACRSLCRGAFQIIVATQDSLVEESVNKRLTSCQKTFNKRFEAFNQISEPPRLSYADFLQGSDLKEAQRDEVLLSAEESFNSANSMFQEVLVILEAAQKEVQRPCLDVTSAEVTSLLKVSIGNSLFVANARSFYFCNSEGSANVGFDFSVNSHYCIMKMLK